MNNPFKISEDKLKTLLAGYDAWLESDPKEAAYPGIFREQGRNVREDFLNAEQLGHMSDDELYEKIFKYSRKLEGPVHMRLGEPRLRGDLNELRRNMAYIATTTDSPFTVAQEILEGKYKIEVFAKAFWSPILQAQFPDVLPNWNNKTEKFLKKFEINISTSKLSIAERYRTLSEAFTFLRSLSEDHDFYTINHLMHYGTEIPEGIKLIENITGRVEPVKNPGTNPYFDITGFKEYQGSFGQKYESQSDATKWYKETTNKLEYLVQLLKEELNKNLAINYKERPSARAGRGKPFILKNYAITGFSPDGIYPEKGELFIKMAFHNLDKSPLFDIELDQNHQAPERPFHDIIDNLRETSRLSIPVDDNFPNNWEKLVENIRPHVENLIEQYRQLTNKQRSEKKTVPMNIPLNTILYGPPGTGKTYHSISYAVAIINNEKIEDVLNRCERDRESVKKRYEELVEKEQIVFCTFHQSMGYEDFVEGIKPKLDDETETIDGSELSYIIEDGIFKKLCTDSAFSFVQQNVTSETQKVLDFSEEYDRYVQKASDKLAENKKPQILTISGQKLYIDSVSQKNNLSIKHINGTRSYIVSKNRLSIIAQAYPDLNEVSNINEQFRAAIGGSNASAYWAVLNAIRNQHEEPRIEKKLPISEKTFIPEERKRAVKTLKNEDYQIVNPKRFVLIIDEINRGNVAQIFGELITLLEDDKRLGKNEALKAELPYSHEKFGVPCNLYIVGTMNTADRSVEALDTALRRRFSFVHMKPEVDKLSLDCDGINLQKLLETLNRRLRILKDEDHTIGHAWLMGVKNLQDLKEVFANKILPLLQEYFYNDYEKLGLVLGDAFFVAHERVGSNEFAEFKGSNGLAGQYNNMYIYKLKNPSELTRENFLDLTTAVTDNEI